MGSLLNLCEDALNTSCDDVAIEYYYYEKDEVTCRVIKYKELKNSVVKLANILSKFTQNRSVAIGLAMPPCPELIIGMLSTLRAECAYAPINLGAKPEILKKIAGYVAMRYILTLGNLKHNVECVLSECGYHVTVAEEVKIDENRTFLLLEIDIKRTMETRFDFRKIAYVLHTSGTTGAPKIIVVPHNCIIPNIVHLGRIFNVTKSSKVALMSPPTFDPSAVDIYASLSNRATLVIPSLEIKMEPAILLDVLFSRAKVTVFQVTSTLVKRFPLHGLRHSLFCDNSSLETIVLGGEQSPPYTTIKKWLNLENVEKETLPNAFFNIYGITEVSTWATCYKLPAEKIFHPDGSAMLLGNPLWKTHLQIRSKDTNSVICTIKSSFENENLAGPEKVIIETTSDTSPRISGRMFIGGDERLCYILGQDDDEYRDSGDLVELVHENGEARLSILGRRALMSACARKQQLDMLSEKISQISDVNACHVMDVDKCIVGFLVRGEKMLISSEKTHVITSSESKLWVLNCYKILAQDVEFDLLPDQICVINNLPVTYHEKVDTGVLEEIYKAMRMSATTEKAREYITLALQQLVDRYESVDLSDLLTRMRFSKVFQESCCDPPSDTLPIKWLDVLSDKKVTASLQSISKFLFKSTFEDFVNIINEKFDTRNKREASNCRDTL